MILNTLIASNWNHLSFPWLTMAVKICSVVIQISTTSRDAGYGSFILFTLLQLENFLSFLLTQPCVLCSLLAITENAIWQTVWMITKTLRSGTFFQILSFPRGCWRLIQIFSEMGRVYLWSSCWLEIHATTIHGPNWHDSLLGDFGKLKIILIVSLYTF